MEKHKVLHIITELALGGAQKNAFLICKELSACGVDVHLAAAPRGGLYSEVCAEKNIKTFFLPELCREISPLNDLICVLKIYRYIKKHRIDIVHTHSSKAGIIGRRAAALSGVKSVVHSIHGWSFHDHCGRFRKILYVLLERFSARSTGAFIAVSRADIAKGLAHGIGKPGQYAFIPYGIDPSGIEKAKQEGYKKEDFGIRPDQVTIGMIACFKPQKNHALLISAAADIVRSFPSVRFVLVGDGVLRAEICRQIEKEGLRENFLLLGWRQDVYKLMPIFDIIVLTSLWEGLPIALLEAMAFAKPIVAADADGIKEIITEGSNGFLVPKNDSEEFCRKLSRLIGSAGLRESMGRASRAVFEEKDFSKTRMMRAVCGLYEQLLNENNKGNPKSQL